MAKFWREDPYYRQLSPPAGERDRGHLARDPLESFCSFYSKPKVPCVSGAVLFPLPYGAIKKGAISNYSWSRSLSQLVAYGMVGLHLWVLKSHDFLHIALRVKIPLNPSGYLTKIRSKDGCDDGGSCASLTKPYSEKRGQYRSLVALSSSAPLRLIPQIRFPSGSLKEWEALLFVRAYCASRLRMKPVDGSDKWPPTLTLNRPFQLFCFQYCIYVIWIIVDCKIVPLWVVRYSQDTLIWLVWLLNEYSRHLWDNVDYHKNKKWIWPLWKS